jgi:DNA polymerase bacteriophage-type
VVSVVTIDFETRSARNLKRSGSYEYAKDPSTLVLVLVYKLDGQPEQEWLPGSPNPESLFEVLRKGAEVHAHNAFFEKCVWWFIMCLKWGWPPIDDEQWHCTAAQASVLSLPRSLEACGDVLDLRVKKRDTGRGLIKALCQPRKPTKLDPSPWNNDPQKLRELYDYCKDDVGSEFCLATSIPRMIDRERHTWLLDQKINMRGIPVDMTTVSAALTIANQVVAAANEEISALTDGVITKGTQDARIKKWVLQEFPHLSLPNMQEPTVNAILQTGELSGTTSERLLEIRQLVSKASCAKYAAVSDMVSADGRVRNCLLFYGANTGRWSGKAMQPHNLPRAGVPLNLIEPLIGAIRSGSLQVLQLCFGDGLKALSLALRNVIQAPPGKKLIVVDFAAIEARVLAWLAGEEWKMQAFRDFDTLTGNMILDKKGELVPERLGNDIYIMAADKVKEAYGIEVGRQAGKVIELAFGYQGAVGAWEAMAKGYSVDLGQSEGPEVDEVTRDWCLSNWSRFCKLEGYEPKDPRRNPSLSMEDRSLLLKLLSPESWVRIKREALADTLKKSWRKAHPSIVKYWKDVQEAAIHATEHPGPQFVGNVCFYRQGRYLYCRLPSGRNITYCDPEVKMRKTIVDDNGEDKIVFRKSFSYMRSKGNLWYREYSYGGSLVENITQGVARDFLVDAMFLAELHKYEISFHVHDEIIAEVDEDFGSAEELEQIMSQVPVWGEGCPIAAAGFESNRYHK